MTSTGGKLRILHTIRSVSPASGGPIEGVKQLANAGRAFGIEIEVASLDDPAELFIKEFPQTVHALGPSTLNYGYSSRLYPWLLQNGAEYDVIVVNGIWQYHSFCTWRAAQKLRVPYVVFPHGMLDPWFKRTYPFKHLKKWLYWPWAEYWVIRDARAVLFTCDEERILARESFWLYSAREHVINYGTAPPSSAAEEAISTFIKEFPSLKGKRIILFMGRLHAKKGCDLALAAFAAHSCRDPRLHLVFCGPDFGVKEKLESSAREAGILDRVTFTGMITGESKWGALYLAEVLFLPSHQENFGIVVAEALAAGTPVLITTKVNIWREVKEAGAGLVGDDNLQGSSQMFKDWIEISDEDRDIMKKRALKCFEERFGISTAVRSIHDKLQEVAALRPGGRAAHTESQL